MLPSPSPAKGVASSPGKGVKKGVDADDSRRKREATTISLRKDKKEDSLAKRRRDPSGGSSSSSSTRPDPPGSLPDPALKLKLDQLPMDMAMLRSDDPVEQLEAVTRFRKLLSIERNPPIAEVIAAGAVPRLVQYCMCYDNRELLFEAAWCARGAAPLFFFLAPSL